MTEYYANHPPAVRRAVVKTFLCPARRGPGEAITDDTFSPPIVLPCGCQFSSSVVFSGASVDYAGMGLYAFGSWHAAGLCQFAFCDGRVTGCVRPSAPPHWNGY